MREQLVRKVEIIPLEVVVRNMAAGSLVDAPRHRRKATQLPRPLVEYLLQERRPGHDPMVSEEHIAAFGWATPQEYRRDAWRSPLRMNDYMTGLLAGCRPAGWSTSSWSSAGSIENDHDMPRIVLADEISPDSCRLWDVQDRREAGQGPLPPRSRRRRRRPTQEVARRLGIIKESGDTDNVVSFTGGSK
jgi:phosphoribosylaminoimidazole-succinocarboxamide synthase